MNNNNLSIFLYEITMIILIFLIKLLLSYNIRFYELGLTCTTTLMYIFSHDLEDDCEGCQK